ncbi:MAG: hypothetical protein K2J01_07000 [Clostridiales bacterium]|nr:hypothetical protein [Clostridiales bacterium]
MTETINSESTKNIDLVYTESFWTGRRQLRYGEIELTRKSNKKFVGETDGGEVEFSVHGNRFKGIYVESATLQGPVCVVRKLTVLEYILAVLVLVPALIFGAVGGAVGGVIACVNLYVMPKIETLWLKITVALEFTAVSGFTAFWIAYAFGTLFW